MFTPSAPQRRYRGEVRQIRLHRPVRGKSGRWLGACNLRADRSETASYFLESHNQGVPAKPQERGYDDRRASRYSSIRS
jgi:hypothetical protein